MQRTRGVRSLDRAMRVLPSGTALTLRHGEVILDAIKRHGFTHRHGCRRGGCGRCLAKVLEGTTSLTAPVSEAVLSTADREAGMVLTCRATANEDLVISLCAGDELHMVAPLLACTTREANSPSAMQAVQAPPTKEAPQPCQ